MLDKTILNQFIGSGDPEDKKFYRDLFDQFYIDTKKILDKIENDLVNENFNNIKSEAHAIKGMALNVGAFRVSQIAVELENSAEDNSIINLRNEMSKLIYELDLTKEEVSKVVK